MGGNFHKDYLQVILNELKIHQGDFEKFFFKLMIDTAKKS